MSANGTREPTLHHEPSCDVWPGMAATRGWGVSFEYDAASDIVFCYPCGTVASIEDAKGFNAACAAYYATFNRKVDVVTVVEMWSIEIDLTTYMNLRAEIMERYIRYNVMVAASHQVVSHMKGYSHVPGAPVPARDTASAIKSILERRKRG